MSRGLQIESSRVISYQPQWNIRPILFPFVPVCPTQSQVTIRDLPTDGRLLS